MNRLMTSAMLGALVLAACTPNQQSTAIGALGGAALGAAVSSDKDKTQGIVTGAAVGALAGSLIGPANQPGQCWYNDGYGNRYVAPC